MEAVAAVKKQGPLSVEEATKLLQSNNVIYTAVPPSQPKAGKVHLFRPDKNINIVNFAINRNFHYKKEHVISIIIYVTIYIIGSYCRLINSLL